nr:glycoside hydrolase family 3 protein [Mangrovihabitans endophyticus]
MVSRVVRRFPVALAVPLVLVAPLALTAGCGSDAPPAPAASATARPSGPAPSAGSASPSPSPTGDPAERAAAAVRRMTDADLAGQVLMPYAYGNDATRVDAASIAGNRQIGGVDTPAQMITKFRLGGLILVGFSAQDPTGSTNPTTNVENPEQVRTLTAGLQQAAAGLPSGAPLLIGTDQEYGVVTRVTDGVTMLPSAMGFGAAGAPRLTETAWHAAGAELAAMGINLDFAPVADTLGAQGSAVLGSRAYGADAKANAEQVAAAVRGLQSAGVSAALKHFPGHGHTTADSHAELPVVEQSMKAWKNQDRPPFTAGIAAGADVVMSGHLDVKALDPGVAATFSHKVMTDVLRGQMKFTGVAVTDAMNMAPAKKWSPGEAAVRALNAGNDLLLMPPDLIAARDGIVAGLADKSLPRSRLEEAVTRILTLKFRRAGAEQPELSTVNSAEHQQAARAAAAAAITVLRGSCTGPQLGGVAVTVTAARGREVARVALVKALQAAGVEVHASGGKIVHLVGYGDRTTDLRSDADVTVMMDTPYLLSAARSPVLIATYSSSPASMAALADLLAGRADAPGRSPVAVSGLPRSVCRT